MSVNVNVIGRLGNDSEVVNGKNGQFVSFRLATDEFKNGEKGTAWFRVAFNGGERGVKMSEWLKKGRLVNVIGTESVSIYTDKSGQPQISRDINAHMVDFVSIGSGQTQSNTSETTNTSAQQAAQVAQPTPANAVKAPEDDLPF